MSATEASRHHQANRRDPQQLAGLQSDSKTDTTTDVVPLIAKVLVKAHRFSALVAAMLITLLLVWVFAHEKVGVSPGLAHGAAPMDPANDTRPAAASVGTGPGALNILTAPRALRPHANCGKITIRP